MDFYPILSHSVSQTVHTQCVHCWEEQVHGELRIEEPLVTELLHG